jgi:hypothetical protein
MRTIRFLAMSAVGLVFALMLAQAPSRAEPQAAETAGAPDKLISPPKRSTRVHRAEATRKYRRTAKRREARAVRLPSRALTEDHVMRGPDNIGLIARLPWWRPIEMQAIHYPDKEFVSQVLTTADTWFAMEMTGTVAGTGAGVRVLAADEINELDLAADRIRGGREPNPVDLVAAYMPETSDQSWLHALLAMLGGALAAASAARFLFV